MGRKTVDVSQLVGWVNTRLAVPDSAHRFDGMSPEQAYRAGVASLLEQVLHATGNYRGFGYQQSERVPDSDYPLREGYDDTRRVYYG
jgi:hypothetical protein